MIESARGRPQRRGPVGRRTMADTTQSVPGRQTMPRRHQEEVRVSRRAFVTLIRSARCAVTAIPLMGVLAGCSQTDDPNIWYNKTLVENFGGHTTPSPDAPGPPIAAADASYATAAAPGVAMPANPIPAGGPVPPSELYWSETSCGAEAATLAPSPMALPPTDIALTMTECDVARRAGRPDKVELPADGNGLRTLTLAYLRGPQPRVYHFTAGRLVSIEFLPPPPPPAPPSKRHARTM